MFSKQGVKVTTIRPGLLGLNDAAKYVGLAPKTPPTEPWFVG